MDQKENWTEKNYSFFQNTKCECFPCHKTDKPETFNCLFCYCPLYALGKHCPGSYVYMENGIKDCSGCLFPHIKENYGDVIAFLGKLHFDDSNISVCGEQMQEKDLK